MLLRAALLAPAALLLTFASAQMPEQKVTIKIPAMPAGKALQQLGQATKTTLAAAITTANDVITVNVHDAPLKDVMAKIAQVTDSSWSQQGTEWKLVRTDADLKAEQEKIVKNSIVNIRKGLNDFIAKGEALPAFDDREASLLFDRLKDLVGKYAGTNQKGMEFYRQVTAIESTGPSNRTLFQMAKLLDPVKLAASRPDRQLVFSTQPNKMQLALHPKALQIAQEFVRYQQTWAKAAGDTKLESPIINGTQWYLGDMYEHRDASPKQPAKVLLTVMRSGDALYIEMLIGDADGNIIGRARNTTTDAHLDAMTSEMKPAGAEDPAINVPENAKTFFRALVQESRQSRAKAPADVTAVVTQPEERDPLSLIASELLSSYAEAQNANLVACLPDGLSAPYIFQSLDNLSTSGLVQRFLGYGAPIETKNGWVTCQPDEPTLERDYRADRKALGNYLRAVVAKGDEMTLDELAGHMAKLPVPSRNNMPIQLAFAISGSSPASAFNEHWLQLYGSLDEGQRNAVQGDGLQARMLRPDQQRILNNLLYNGYIYLSPDLKGEQSQAAQEKSMAFSATLKREVTEGVPDGIPADALLKMQRVDEPVVFVGTNPMNARQVAVDMFAQSNPNYFPANFQKVYVGSAEVKVREGRRLDVQLTCTFPGDVYVSGALRDAKPKGPEISYEQVSPEFKKLVEAVTEEIKKRLGIGG